MVNNFCTLNDAYLYVKWNILTLCINLTEFDEVALFLSLLPSPFNWWTNGISWPEIYPKYDDNANGNNFLINFIET